MAKSKKGSRTAKSVARAKKPSREKRAVVPKTRIAIGRHPRSKNTRKSAAVGRTSSQAKRALKKRVRKASKKAAHRPRPRTQTASVGTSTRPVRRKALSQKKPVSKRPAGKKRASKPVSKRPVVPKRASRPASKKPVAPKRSPRPASKKPVAPKRASRPASKKPVVPKRRPTAKPKPRVTPVVAEKQARVVKKQVGSTEPPPPRRARPRRRRPAPATLDRLRRILPEADESPKPEEAPALPSPTHTVPRETAEVQQESATPAPDTVRQTELERLKALVERLNLGD